MNKNYSLFFLAAAVVLFGIQQSFYHAGCALDVCGREGLLNVIVLAAAIGCLVAAAREFMKR